MAATLAAEKPQKICRLLLIDDNRHGLSARKTILADKGYDVATAESGEQGLEIFDAALAAEPFQLVVTDYRMPAMWGDEVVRRVKSADATVPVVILSGYTIPLALTTESTGADIVLSKGPREQHELVRAVETLLPAHARPQPKEPASEGESSTGARYSRRRRGTSAS